MFKSLRTCVDTFARKERKKKADDLQLMYPPYPVGLPRGSVPQRRQ
jgi:hypothetical protein